MVANNNTPPGPAVDARGQAVIDPTANVLQLVEAAIKRQDDLRTQGEKHIKEMQEVQSEHYKELRVAETERINSIRAVDVGNVQRAAEVQATQALTLATQVTTSADALRGQVEAARQQTATALAAALEPIQKDIQDLRRVQYEGVGGKQNLAETQAASGEQHQSASLILAIIVGSASVLLGIIGLVITLVLRG